MILMRVVRGSLIESMSKDMKELRKYTIEISRGIPPGRRTNTKGEESLHIPAAARKPVWLKGRSRLEDCRSEM